MTGNELRTTPEPLTMHDLRIQVKALSSLSPIRSALELSSTWAQLVFFVGFYAVLQTWWAFCIAFLLVGARQYGLLILLHDASHSLLHSNRKINDRIALWLIAAPCGSSFHNSRRLHLLHHQNLGKGCLDPDFFYYSSGDPFPKNTKFAFLSHFARLLLGRQVFHTLFNASTESASQATIPLKKLIPSLLPVATMQFVLLALFSAVGVWYGYFLLWLLPLVTLAVFFNGVRTFADHANHGPDVLDRKALLISYLSNPIERFFFSPYHMNFHAEHHHFPFVPHYSLPKIRKLMEETPEARESTQWRGSYFKTLLRYFLCLGK